MHPFLTIATEAARKAGRHALRASERLDQLQVSQKAEGDYVTAVDKACEQIIIEQLQKAYPQHGFLGEESGEIAGQGEFRWVIDPIDGTTNYVQGYPNYCIVLACEWRGQVEHALIYDPVRDDIYTASRGSGAYCNNRRIRVRPVHGLGQALVGLSFNKRELNPTRLAGVHAMTVYPGAMRRSGSAALDLAHVAAGRLSACVQWGMRWWDIAAGSLLVREAGGAIEGLEGDDWSKTGSLVAGPVKLLPEILARLKSAE